MFLTNLWTPRLHKNKKNDVLITDLERDKLFFFGYSSVALGFEAHIRASERGGCLEAASHATAEESGIVLVPPRAVVVPEPSLVVTSGQ